MVWLLGPGVDAQGNDAGHLSHTSGPHVHEPATMYLRSTCPAPLPGCPEMLTASRGEGYAEFWDVALLLLLCTS